MFNLLLAQKKAIALFRRTLRSRKFLYILWFLVSLAIPIGLYLLPITPEFRAIVFVVSAIAAGLVGHRVDVRSRLRGVI